jgi:DNA-binding NarL/FixJ family response regulator
MDRSEENTRAELRILLVEDSAIDAELIRDALDRSGVRAVYSRVQSEREFAEALRTFAPDVVLSDQALVQFDAPAALDTLRAAVSIAPVVVVTRALDERMTVASLRAGADDVVLKTSLSRLSAAIDSALRTRIQLRTLSPRQVEVLRLVAQGLTTGGIARLLKVSEKTVESHRGEVMERLGIHNVVGLVRFALRHGLVPPDA